MKLETCDHIIGSDGLGVFKEGEIVAVKDAIKNNIEKFIYCPRCGTKLVDPRVIDPQWHDKVMKDLIKFKTKYNKLLADIYKLHFENPNKKS